MSFFLPSKDGWFLPQFGQPVRTRRKVFFFFFCEAEKDEELKNKTSDKKATLTFSKKKLLFSQTMLICYDYEEKNVFLKFFEKKFLFLVENICDFDFETTFNKSKRQVVYLLFWYHAFARWFDFYTVL